MLQYADEKFPRQKSGRLPWSDIFKTEFDFVIELEHKLLESKEFKYVYKIPIEEMVYCNRLYRRYKVVYDRI
jgi:hypothetical protein